MIQSTSPVVTQAPTAKTITSMNDSCFLPSSSVNSKSSNPDDVVDISNTRKLLRPVSIDSGLQSLTPRKRALARKTSNNLGPTSSSNDMLSPQSNGSSVSLSTSQKPQPEVDDLEPEADDPEARITLFQFRKARILSFENISETMEENDKLQGRLLGHGKFEIYQLHQKRVSYLQCGSVVYPILPRLKVLKISPNQFIIPLSNPERYWRIVIESEDQPIIKALEDAFKGICHFRNLYINSESKSKPKSRPAARITNEEVKDLKTFDNRSSVSVSSITTDVACFALESDSSTYVEEFNGTTTNLETLPTEKQRTLSNASSLDIELDGFIKELETTQYYTAYPSLSLDSIEETQSNGTVLVSPNDADISSPLYYYDKSQRDSVLSIPKTRSRSSRSTSLYQSETSWMDPEDEPFSSSTPNTRRYISLNVNPNTSFGSPRDTKLKDKRIVTEPFFKGKPSSLKTSSNLRFSSYDVYNILKDEDTSTREKEPGFRDFLTSFFT